MDLLATDEQPHALLPYEAEIRDGVLTKFSVYYDETGLCATLDMDLIRTRKHNAFHLLFKGVQEYAFSWRSDRSFYNIEQCKLQQVDGLFYLTLDPEDESADGRGEHDNDFILAENLLLYKVG